MKYTVKIITFCGVCGTLMGEDDELVSHRPEYIEGKRYTMYCYEMCENCFMFRPVDQDLAELLLGPEEEDLEEEEE